MSKGYQFDPPAIIHPAIMIGAGMMLTPSFIQKYKITHVINCAYPEDCPVWVSSEFGNNYECLMANDGFDVDILDWYPLFRKTLSSFLRDPSRERVFVHCQCGINRSMFLTTAFVCEVFGYPYEETIRSLKQQRPCALKNYEFARQVKMFVSKKKA